MDESRDELEQLRRRVAELEEVELPRYRIMAGVRNAIWSMKDSEDIAQVLTAIRNGLLHLKVPFEECGVNMVDESVNPLSVWIHNMTEDGYWTITDPPGAKAILRFWREQEVVYRPDLRAEDPYGEGGYLTGYGGPKPRAVVDVPFCCGTLAVCSRTPHVFTPEHIARLQDIGQVLSEGFLRMRDFLLLERRNRELEQEIVRRERLEEELTASERRYRMLFDSTNDAAFIADVEGNLLDVNQRGCEQVGRSREELLKMRVEGIVHADYIDRVKEHIAMINRQGHMVIETGHKHRDGSLIPVELSARIIDYEGKKAILGMARDISERKGVEQELIRLERLRALEELAAGISHNLNNILTGIMGPAQLLQRMIEDAEPLVEVGDILSAARHARDVVRRLHESVHGEEGMSPEAVPVAEVVEDALEVTRPRWKDEAEANGIAIEVETRLGETPPIRGSWPGLRNILVNLLLNAVEAMPEGGRIRIRTEAEGNGVRLTCGDTGVGMDEETRRRVFEPFFTTKLTVDAGLGLSTVYGTLQRWGGEIEVESQPGTGTTFILRLPLWEEQGKSRAEHAGRLLVVEDAEDVRMVLQRYLSRRHQVEVVADGEEALARFSAGRYDAVLIDLGMPGMPGNQVAQEMRRLDPQVATVLITGWTLAEEDSRRDPFDLYVGKPFHLDTVGEQVKQAIAIHDERAGDRGPAD